VARQTRHLSKLVDDLLDVARVTTGKVILHNVTLDINEVLRRCLQAAQMGAQKIVIEIVPILWPQPLSVLGDMVRLEEVFGNLLWNAIKYSPAHSRIDVSTTLEGEHCVLEVRDTGIGITPEMLPRVFDLFTQAEVSLDRTQAGLGIGLTLVKSLVELHGGSVSAHSDGIGTGSRFRVSLPLTESALSEVVPLSTLEDEQPPPLPVLVVDDNMDLLEMTKEVLEGFGCQVQTASDGPSGLAQLCAFPPALAFIDIGLPGLDGYRLVTEARANASLRSASMRPWLVALTGYGQPEDRQRALAAGFDQHLTKPVSINALRQAIKDASGAMLRQRAD
jgi:CheY-like chemotaxis protein